MANRDIIVIGASAGGIEAVKAVLRGLPETLPASVFVVIHQAPTSPATLASVLAHGSGLPVEFAEDYAVPRPGVVYVAPPDVHLVLRGNVMRTVRGPRENRHRPAVDPLFRSAALHHGPRVVGVILSGFLDDGAAGIAAVSSQKGITIVQDPQDAVAPGMPSAALRTITPDHVAPLGEIASLIVRRSREEMDDPVPEADQPFIEESKQVENGMPMSEHEHAGAPAGFSCPDCGGVLWELDDHDVLRYRCRVGHSYSTDTMVSAQDDDVEEALWSALNILNESAELSRRLAERERSRGNDWIVRNFEARAESAGKRAEVIRRVLMKNEALRGEELQSGRVEEWKSGRVEE